jgi:poly(A) polymerase
MLQLVPHKDRFEIVLRCIKLWAKNRGIYSNVLGYFGGITWALLVAKVCIENRDALPNKLLARFFEYYRDYPWSPKHPITIAEIQNDLSIAPGAKIDENRMVQWETLKRTHMPVITPTFPCMNSTHNVS